MPKIVDHDARRAELVAASWNVIAREGLEGLTMRKVAAAAGCTTGRITHYFADREALVLAALTGAYDACAARMAAVAASDRDPADKLLGVLEETLPLDDTRLHEWRIWIAFWGAAATDPDLAEENDHRHVLWTRFLEPLIAEIAPACDAAHEARVLSGIVDGLGLLAAVHPTPANRKLARGTVQQAVQRLRGERG